MPSLVPRDGYSTTGLQVGFWLVTATEEKPPATRWNGLSRTADGRRVPSAAERARGYLTGLRPSERAVGWLAPIGITLLAFALRMYHLGTPKRFAFDETYYAKDAWSLLNNGYAQTYLADVDGNKKNKIDDDILAGNVNDVWTGDPSMAVHPDVGKWLIGLGEKAFGMDPFGWRVASAVVGALMVLVICRLLRRMTGSTVLGCIGGLLLMFDGLHFVLSRLALLDIFLAFFILCAVHCLVADRDHFRRRLGRRTSDDEGRPIGWGPVASVLFRPWLIAGGICFGLAAGTKWTAVYPLAAFGLLVWFWSAGARRSFGVRWPLVKSALADGLPAFVQIVIVGVLTYIATWSGWLANAGEYEDHLSATQYRQYTGHGHCAEDDDSYIATDLDESKRWATADEKDATRRRRGLAVAPVALVLPPGRLHVPRPFPELRRAHLRVEAVELAAHQPPGRGRGHQRHPAGRPRSAAGPAGPPARRGLRRARGQRLHPTGAADRDPDDLVGRLHRAAVLGPDVDRRARLEVRRRRDRHAVDLVALDAVRRPADLLLLRDRHAAVHRDRPDAVDRHPHRTVPAPVEPAHDRGGGERRVRRSRTGQLRLVLADLDQRAADQQRVAGPDLVLAMGVTTMSRTQLVGAAVAAVLVAVVVFLLVRGDDDGSDPAGVDPRPSASTDLPVVADEVWCAGWQNLVALQGQYVASPTPDGSAALLAAVDAQQELGVPENLDPAGYTELTAVLDDLRASVDPSFTPTAVPSEPADVAVEGGEDEDEGGDDDEHEGHGADADEAPFGAWLAEYCSV